MDCCTSIIRSGHKSKNSSYTQLQLFLTVNLSMHLQNSFVKRSSFVVRMHTTKFNRLSGVQLIWIQSFPFRRDRDKFMLFLSANWNANCFRQDLNSGRQFHFQRRKQLRYFSINEYSPSQNPLSRNHPQLSCRFLLNLVLGVLKMILVWTKARRNQIES